MLLTSTPEYGTTTNIVVPDGNERTATTTVNQFTNVPEYKAAIHINLFGGMDSLSMIAPHPNGCQSLYDEYNATRGEQLYLQPSEMVEISVGVGSDPQPCSSFGVNKRLDKLADIYNAGDGLFISNIGILTKPVTRENFRTETKAKLFSHEDMKSSSFVVDAFDVFSGSGVLGRVADVLGETMATGQTNIDKILSILYGDQSLGRRRKVDVISSGGNGVDELYSVNKLGAVSYGLFCHTFLAECYFIDSPVSYTLFLLLLLHLYTCHYSLMRVSGRHYFPSCAR